MRKLILVALVLFALAAVAMAAYENANQRAGRADPMANARKNLQEQLDKAKTEGKEGLAKSLQEKLDTLNKIGDQKTKDINAREAAAAEAGKTGFGKKIDAIKGRPKPQKRKLKDEL